MAQQGVAEMSTATATSWRTVRASLIAEESSEECAEVVLICGTDPVCASSRAGRALLAAARVSFDASAGNSLDLRGEEGAPRLLLLGIGTEASEDCHHWMSLGGHLLDAMARHRMQSVRLPASSQFGGAQRLEYLLLGALLHGFAIVKPGSQVAQVRSRCLLIAPEDAPILEVACRCALALNRARAWVEQPANFLTPIAWSQEASALLTGLGANVRVLGPRKLEELGAGALVAVGRGGSQGAHLLIAEWRGDADRNEWDAMLVGKGVTFDAGGLNLKTQPNISRMKLDMAGGAAVIGALELAMARRSRANIVAVVPIAENLIDALSYRPGDVIATLSGLTVEVADTDAEGRLVLADAITYGLRNYSPRCMVDLATLTTAVTRVLHGEFAGLYSNDPQFADELVRAGTAVGERLWPLPLDASQDYLIESDIADLSNTGKPGLFGFGAGSPTAGAKFLEKFTAGTRWAHIDITGVVWSDRHRLPGGRGATGFGVRLLDHWLACRERELNECHRSLQ